MGRTKICTVTRGKRGMFLFMWPTLVKGGGGKKFFFVGVARIGELNRGKKEKKERRWKKKKKNKKKTVKKEISEGNLKRFFKNDTTIPSCYHHLLHGNTEASAK